MLPGREIFYILASYYYKELRMDLDRLRQALADADIPVLLMVLVHLTGDTRWIEGDYKPVRDNRIIAEPSGGLSPEIQQEVRDALFAEIERRDGKFDDLTIPDDRILASMMETFLGRRVPPEYLGLVRSDLVGLGIDSAVPAKISTEVDLDTVIVGAGVSGIAAGVRLSQAGVPFKILERNDGVGGTWRNNTYPEAGVDTPNHFYSLSFARKNDWPYYFSKQPELLKYLEKCVDDFELRDRIEFESVVTRLTYDDALQHWTTEYTDKNGVQQKVVSRFVITALGLLNEPSVPKFPGIDQFTGQIIHTSRWPAGVDLAGKRVALVGVGASGVQAARSIAQEAESLVIYQRSPQWIMPNPDYHAAVSDEKQYLLKHLPFYADWYRLGLFWRYGDGLLPSLRQYRRPPGREARP